MMNFCFTIIAFYFIEEVYASHYINNPVQGVKLSEEESQSINARSPVECILKCGNIFQKRGFYTDKGLCFCTDGWKLVKTEVLKDQVEGIVYSKREGKKVTYLDDFEIPGRK